MSQIINADESKEWFRINGHFFYRDQESRCPSGGISNQRALRDRLISEMNKMSEMTTLSMQRVKMITISAAILSCSRAPRKMLIIRIDASSTLRAARAMAALVSLARVDRILS